MARSTEYDPAIADAICAEVADGASLRAICEAKGMPARSTVFKWLSENKGFSDQYARAREAQAELYADEIIGIADTEPDTQKARVMIDARKWKAGKLKPKVYGEKVTNELVGDPARPVAITVLSGVPRPDDGS